VIRRFILCVALATGILIPVVSASAQTRTPTTPPSGSIGIRLLEAPVNRENDPRAKIYIVDHISQGTTISRKIEVSNATTTTRVINLYAGAATIKGGEFTGGPGAGGDDLASWTSIAPGQVTVPAGQRAEATVTIAVPGQAGDGERYGVIWAETAPTPNAGAVTVVNRVGIRMYLSVGTGTEPKSDFTIDTLTAKRLSTGEPAVTAMVTNIGGRALDMGGNLLLKNGPGGLTAGPFNAQLGTTLGIGQREPVTVKLDKRLPAGPWDAVIDLKSGTIEHSAHATIFFPKAGSSTPVKAKSNSSLGKTLKVILPLAGLVAALFGAILFVLWRRRRDKDDDNDIKGDLRRFDKLMKQQLEGTLAPDAEDPEVAIKAAIKQAGRAGDKETERRLKEKLAEFRAARDAATPAPVPAPQPEPAPPPIAPTPAAPAPAPSAPFVPAPAPAAPVHAPSTPQAPARPTPDLAEILAGEPVPEREPTRWSGLVEDIRNRKGADESAADDGDSAEDAPSDMARAVREAAEKARQAAEDAASQGH
jgi:hypothetical protein